MGRLGRAPGGPRLRGQTGNRQWPGPFGPLAHKAMIWEFSAQAARQLEFVVSSYNMKLPGLGEQFLDEFTRVVDFILVFPDASPRFSASTRSCLVRRFPYRVIYQVLGGRILIHAIPHQHSDPDTWLTE